MADSQKLYFSMITAKLDIKLIDRRVVVPKYL